MWEKSERIGKMLVNMGLVDQDQVEEALSLSMDNGKTLGQNMFELGHVADSSLLQLLVAQGAATPWFLSQTPPEPRVLRLLSPSVMREHMLLPIVRMADLLLIAIADDKDHDALERVRTLTGLRIECVQAQPERIKEVIETILNAGREAVATCKPTDAALEKPTLPDTEPVFTQSELQPETKEPRKEKKMKASEEEAQPAPPRITVEDEVVSNDDTAPVVGLIDQIMADSVRRCATEILVDSTPDGFSIRYRVDGQLRSIGDIPKSLAPLVDARLRLIASLDIHDLATPQIGKVEYKTGARTVEFDAFVVPTRAGSRFLFRRRPSEIKPVRLEELGLAKNELELVRESLYSTEGLLIVTGPTIEDRASCLYSVLMDLASPARDIVTCEEHVFGEVHGVSHSSVVIRHSRSRADYLSLLLRYAPDVLMVDDLTDDATASVAVRASLAGRLVVGGIESKGALNTVARLFDLGVDPYLVSASVCGVLAKRTLRTLCPSCKKKSGKVWKAGGCGDCEGTGYQGTTDVFEFLPMTDAVSRLVAARASASEIEVEARKAGFRPMCEHAATKLERGETDEREIANVFNRPVEQEPLSVSLEELVPVAEAKVEAAVDVASEADMERNEFASKVKKEREEMNAFFRMQSYEIDGGHYDEAA